MASSIPKPLTPPIPTRHTKTHRHKIPRPLLQLNQNKRPTSKPQKFPIPRPRFRLQDGITLLSLCLFLDLTLNTVLCGKCPSQSKRRQDMYHTLENKRFAFCRVGTYITTTNLTPDSYPPCKKKKNEANNSPKILLATLLYIYSCKKGSKRYLNCNTILWPLYTITVFFADIFWFSLFKDWERLSKAQNAMLATIAFEGIAT